MQQSWSHFPISDWQLRAAPVRVSEDEVAIFLEEVAAAHDRESFLRLTSRFDAQFLARQKARFPSVTGKFPFGSAGKPYTFGSRQTGGYYERPATAAIPQYAPETFQTYQYRVQTPAVSNLPARTDYPYGSPIYDRQIDSRPPSSYADAKFLGRSLESLPGAKGSFTSLSDYAELRKSQEDVLTRFQTGSQHPYR